MKLGAIYMAVWLWLIPALIVFNLFARRSRQRAMEKFASRGALEEISGAFNARRRKIKTAIITIALFLAVLALMRPQIGFKWQEVKKQGLDIMIALDTSKSMLAEDVLPGRLERARLAIKDLVKKMNGDRIGLVAFSGTAFLQCPLTADYDGFLLSLRDVDTDIIPVGGTALAKAIYKAIDSYEGSKSHNKILIIITDGEDLEGGLDGAIEAAKKKGIIIFCVGIGTQSGELIPVDDDLGRRGFLKDAAGNIVKTKLVEEPLRRAAFATGGMYVRASGAEFGLDLIYDEKLSKLEKEEFKARMEKRYNERFQIPLVLAFLLLLIEPLIGERKREVL